MSKENDAQYEFWEELAADWIASVDYTEIVSAPFGDRAMDRRGLHDGQRHHDSGIS